MWKSDHGIQCITDLLGNILQRGIRVYSQCCLPISVAVHVGSACPALYFEIEFSQK